METITHRPIGWINLVKASSRASQVKSEKRKVKRANGQWLMANGIYQRLTANSNKLSAGVKCGDDATEFDSPTCHH